MTGLQNPGHEAQLRSTDHRGGCYLRVAWSRQDKGPGRIKAAHWERPAAPKGALVHTSQGNAIGKAASAGSGEGTLVLELVSPCHTPLCDLGQATLPCQAWVSLSVARPHTPRPQDKGKAGAGQIPAGKGTVFKTTAVQRRGRCTAPGCRSAL